MSFLQQSIHSTNQDRTESIQVYLVKVRVSSAPTLISENKSQLINKTEPDCNSNACVILARWKHDLVQ